MMKTKEFGLIFHSEVTIDPYTEWCGHRPLSLETSWKKDAHRSISTLSARRASHEIGS